jgi:hypothetical protein
MADIGNRCALASLILMELGGISHCFVKSFSQVSLWFCHMYMSDLFLLLPSCYGEISGRLWPYKPSIYCRLAVRTDMGGGSDDVGAGRVFIGCLSSLIHREALP